MEKRRKLRSDTADATSVLGSRAPSRWDEGVHLAAGSWIRDRGAGDSLHRVVRPASNQPRHSSNSRPPRRTRRSVRPAPCRVSDRTMVRLVRPQRSQHVQIGSGVESRSTMRKKTATPTDENQRVSPNKNQGLIAKGKNSQQSGTTESALDNRSHRTIALIERLWA